MGDKTVIVAVANDKGGVGKTTTACNLAAGLAYKLAYAGSDAAVLLVDLDKQGNCADVFGVREQIFDWDRRPEGPCLSKVLRGQAEIEEELLEVRSNLYLLPAGEEVEYAVQELSLADYAAATRGRASRRHVPLDSILEDRLGAVRSVFHFVILDCPPHLGLLEKAVYHFADYVIAPTPLHYLSVLMTGANTLRIERLREHGTRARLLCVVPTMTSPFGEDGRPRHLGERQMYESLVTRYSPSRVAAPVVRSVKVEESPGMGRPIFDYAAGSEPARAYGRLVERVYHVR